MTATPGPAFVEAFSELPADPAPATAELRRVYAELEQALDRVARANAELDDCEERLGMVTGEVQALTIENQMLKDQIARTYVDQPITPDTEGK